MHTNYEVVKSAVLRTFTKLRTTGLVCRSNFTCCGTCGAYEITEMAGKRDNTRGYAFWHRQDETGLRAGGDLYLRFGAFDWSSKTSEEVAQQIVDELRREPSIQVEWNGDPATCIHVKAA